MKKIYVFNTDSQVGNATLEEDIILYYIIKKENTQNFTLTKFFSFILYASVEYPWKK